MHPETVMAIKLIKAPIANLRISVPSATRWGARAGLGCYAIRLPRQTAERSERRRRAPGSIIALVGLMGQCVGKSSVRVQRVESAAP
jgi:hypothetical protein